MRARWSGTDDELRWLARRLWLALRKSGLPANQRSMYSVAVEYSVRVPARLGIISETPVAIMAQISGKFASKWNIVTNSLERMAIFLKY